MGKRCRLYDFDGFPYPYISLNRDPCIFNPKASVQRITAKFTCKEVGAALQALRKSKWLWKPGRCSCGSCGDRLQKVPFLSGLKRGNGRAYLRCPQCRKWFDVLAFSFLPVVRMPLPTVYKAMQMYFQQNRAPSVDEIGRLVGCSGSTASALKKLVKALRAAECRCMDHKQQLRQVAGRIHQHLRCTFSFSVLRPSFLHPVPKS